MLNWWCWGQLPLVSCKGMWVCLLKWNFSFPRTGEIVNIAGSEFKGYESQEVRAHQPNPEGFLCIYVTSDLSLLGRLPLSVVRAVLQPLVYSLLPGVSGFKFTVSAAQTCWGHPALRLRQRESAFSLCTCCAVMCVLVKVFWVFYLLEIYFAKRFYLIWYFAIFDHVGAIRYFNICYLSQSFVHATRLV